MKCLGCGKWLATCTCPTQKAIGERAIEWKPPPADVSLKKKLLQQKDARRGG